MHCNSKVKKAFIILAVTVLLLLLTSCYYSSLEKIVATVSNPELTIKSLYDSEYVLLNMKTSTDSATIMYRYNGINYRNYYDYCSTYTDSDSSTFTAVLVPYGTTVSAYAEKEGMNTSATVTQSISTRTPNPVIINRGTYYSDATRYVISISAPTGSVVYYTTNGNNPSTYGSIYSNSTGSYRANDGNYYTGILVPIGKTVKAVAQAPGYYSSSIVSISL